MRLGKTFLKNTITVVISTGLSLLVFYFIYHKLMHLSEKKAVFQGKNAEYGLVFYNQQGKRLTEIAGKLKIVTDPFTLYRNYPLQVNQTYSINQYGFRGQYKESNLKKAFVIRGSAAFGQGLQSDEETFARRLDNYIQEYDVINAGIVGILSGQELSYMVHYLDNFKPDLYVVFDGWNDIFSPFMYVKEFPSGRIPIGFHFAFFEIENRLESFHKLKTQEKSQKYKFETEQISPVGVRIENEKSLFEEVAKTYVANIDKMRSFAKSRNAAFLLVFQPELGNKRIQSKIEQSILADWERAHGYLKREIPEKYSALIERAKEYCVANNIQFIDLNTVPAFTDNLNTLFLDVVHPNALGHEIIADTIRSVLQRMATLKD